MNRILLATVVVIALYSCKKEKPEEPKPSEQIKESFGFNSDSGQVNFDTIINASLDTVENTIRIYLEQKTGEDNLLMEVYSIDLDTIDTPYEIPLSCNNSSKPCARLVYKFDINNPQEVDMWQLISGYYDAKITLLSYQDNVLKGEFSGKFYKKPDCLFPSEQLPYEEPFLTDSLMVNGGSFQIKLTEE